MVSINAKEERVFVNSILLSYWEPLESKALISFNPFLTTPDRELIIVLFFLINSYFFLLKGLRIGKDMWFIIILCLLVAFDGLDLIFCNKRIETLLVQAFADRIHLSGFISRDLRLNHFSTGSLMMHILILLQQVLLQCHCFLGLLLFGSWGGPIGSMDRFIVFIDLIFEIGRVHLQLPLRVIGLVWVLEVYAIRHMLKIFLLLTLRDYRPFSHLSSLMGWNNEPVWSLPQVRPPLLLWHSGL